MNGIVVMAGALLCFVVAVGGVSLATYFGLLFAGRAMNKRRAPAQRLRQWLFTALCGLGVAAAAAAGWLGIGALMFFAHRP